MGIVRRMSMILLTMIVLGTPLTTFAVTQGTTTDGTLIFDPTASSELGFRYGPSIIRNADNSVDMWMCSPGSGPEWDWIRYRRSTDGGVTWGAESVVLRPTPGAKDALSTCDPGVIKLNGYYYLSYTSIPTFVLYKQDGNDVFVARSTAPTGPWEKWNGSGWGGNPEPFIVHDPAIVDTYGAGEPSLVVKDGTIYIYYTWEERDASGRPIHQTRVRTASASNPNWPGSTSYQGIAIDRPAGTDSADVKYVDSLAKFIAVHTADRFGPYAYVDMWESTNGLTFQPSTLSLSYIRRAAHNVGISGDALGHFDTTKSNFIAYAYGEVPALWYLYRNPITLTNTALPASPDVWTARSGNGSVTLEFRTSGVAGETYTIRYGTSSGSYTTSVSGVTASPYTLTGLTNGTTYYVVVVAHNASGDSPPSRQFTVQPLAYSAAPRVGVTTSSQLVGLEAGKAIDADRSSMWSSNGYTTPNATEWISIDTGAPRAIKRVTLTPRQNTLVCFPSDFRIQVSLDNTTWVDVYNTNGTTVGADVYEQASAFNQRVYAWKEPVWGRYVRIYATRLNHDGSGAGNFYFQLGQIDIEEVPFTASASSILNAGWPAAHVIDGNVSAWSSIGHATATVPEWIQIDAGAAQSITGVRMTPRAPDGAGFPVDFKIQSSPNGTSWTDVPGQSYTAYPNPGGAEQSFPFASAVTARFIRVSASKLGNDSSGTYYFQLVALSLDREQRRTATASSSFPSLDAAKAVDNLPGTFWSSNAAATATTPAWLRLDLGATQTVSGVRMIPRADTCFPLDFELQSSTNGSTWTTIPAQVYRNFSYNYGYGTVVQEFRFNSPIATRYLRVYATELRADAQGDYYFQLGELYVDP